MNIFNEMDVIEIITLNRDKDEVRTIIAMEQEGSERIMGNTILPIQLTGCTEKDLLSLGFTIGDVIHENHTTLFRHGSIPNDWTMKRDSDIHTELFDGTGISRGFISYKNTPYDTWAQLQVKVK